MRRHAKSERLTAALARCEKHAVAWAGVVYRSASVRYANRDDLLTGVGSKSAGARWNPPGSVAAVHSSLDIQTALAEALAHHRYYGFAIETALPRVLVSIQGRLQRVLKLTDPKVRRILGVTTAQLLGEDWRECNRRGEEALTQASRGPYRLEPHRVPRQPAFSPELFARHQPGSTSSATTLVANLHVFLLDRRTVQWDDREKRRDIMPRRDTEHSKKAAPPPPTLAAALRAKLHLPRKTFSRLTGFSERAIAGWEKGRTISEPGLRRMREIERLQERLAEVVQADSVSEWLETPNAAFDGLKPLEVIERGEIDRLWTMIYYLESGVSS